MLFLLAFAFAAMSFEVGIMELPYIPATAEPSFPRLSLSLLLFILMAPLLPLLNRGRSFSLSLSGSMLIISSASVVGPRFHRHAIRRAPRLRPPRAPLLARIAGT